MDGSCSGNCRCCHVQPRLRPTTAPRSTSSPAAPATSCYHLHCPPLSMTQLLASQHAATPHTRQYHSSAPCTHTHSPSHPTNAPTTACKLPATQHPASHTTTMVDPFTLPPQHPASRPHLQPQPSPTAQHQPRPKKPPACRYPLPVRQRCWAVRPAVHPCRLCSCRG